jgi:hypothetical protein
MLNDLMFRAMTLGRSLRIPDRKASSSALSTNAQGRAVVRVCPVALFGTLSALGRATERP